MSTPPSTDELVYDYRITMTRCPTSDWPGLRRRVESAARLARSAFQESSRPAWEVVQVIEWRLQRQSTLRPTDPGDVHVLDALYQMEESTLPVRKLPDGLTPKEFRELLTREILEFAAVESEMMKTLRSGDLEKDDWRYLGYQWLPAAIDFPRMIALASLPLPQRQARLLYRNLFDEAGRGNFEKGHFSLLRKFLEQFDVLVDDEDALLEWAVPEVIAMINTQNRLLWHAEPGWGLGSLFLGEALVPSELSKVREGVLALQLQAESIEFFDEHITVDVEHSADWLSMIEDLLLTPKDQEIAYAGAIQRGRVQRRAWDAAHEGWLQWKRTGVQPHLPARELRATTGV